MQTPLPDSISTLGTYCTLSPFLPCLCITCPNGQALSALRPSPHLASTGFGVFTPPGTTSYSRQATIGSLSPKMPRPFLKFSAALLLLFASLQILCPPASHAEDLNKIAGSGYVIDLAGVLDPNAKSTLTALCAEVEQKTGAQMAIVTVHSFEGRSVEDYAADLYKHLGIGGKKDDRGVLLLVSPDERKYRIEAGYGLEPVINDARAGDVGRAMVPFLRNGNYNGAIQTAAFQLAKYIADDRGVTLSLAAPVRNVRTQQRSGSSLGIWIFLIIVVLVILASRGGGGGGHGWLWFLLGMLLNSGGGSDRGGGGGGFGGGGGGFGGFGGGSSGGGGASGSW
jgi:uncharacterized protein